MLSSSEESVVVPIFKKGLCNDLANRRVISLIPIVSKLHLSVIFLRFYDTRGGQTGEEQVEFRGEFQLPIAEFGSKRSISKAFRIWDVRELRRRFFVVFLGLSAYKA